MEKRPYQQPMIKIRSISLCMIEPTEDPVLDFLRSIGLIQPKDNRTCIRDVFEFFLKHPGKHYMSDVVKAVKNKAPSNVSRSVRRLTEVGLIDKNRMDYSLYTSHSVEGSLLPLKDVILPRIVREVQALAKKVDEAELARKRKEWAQKTRKQAKKKED